MVFICVTACTCSIILLSRKAYFGYKGSLARMQDKRIGIPSGSNVPNLKWNFPIIGSLLTMIYYGSNFNLKYLPQYGDVVQYSVGTMNFYKINEAILAKKIFDKAYDRPAIMKNMFYYAKCEPSFTTRNNNDGGNWEYRRKTTMRHLNSLLQFNINSTIFEDKQNDIIKNEIVNNIINNKNNKNNIWYCRELLRNIAFNSVYFILFGEMLEFDNKLFQRYNKNIYNIVNGVFAGMFCQKLPQYIAKPIFGESSNLLQLSVQNVYYLTRMKLDEYISYKQENNNNNNENNNENKDCLVQRLIDIYQINCDEPNTSINLNNNYGKLSRKIRIERLNADTSDLIIAGTDTCSHTAEVGVALLAKYPKIQSELYHQLSMLEKKNFKYFNQCHLLRAFIYEMLRVACPGPDGAARTSRQDIRCIKIKYNNNDNNNNNKKKSEIICDFVNSKVFNKSNIESIYNNNNLSIEYDYVINKNSRIEANLSYISSNFKIWPNNKNNNNTNDSANNNNGSSKTDFNLNHWLDSDTKTKFVKNNNSIPFGAGKRVCAGQSLAIKGLISLFGNLILNYKIMAVNNDCDAINIEFEFLLVLQRVKQQIAVRVEKRQG